MKVLMISSDKKIFEPDSDVRQRMLVLGEMVDQLDIIIFSLRQHKVVDEQLSDKVKIYPTNSLGRWFYIIDAWRLGRVLDRPNLITAQDPFECGLAAWFLAKLFKAKLELQIHTDFLNLYFIRESALNWFRVKILSLFLIPKANKLRVVSKRIKSSLEAKSWKLKATPVVLPVFVDVEKIRNAPVRTDLHHKYPRFKKIILMASRLTKEKNIDLALKAMPEILARNSDIGLIVVGEGPELKQLKSKALSYGLGHNIAFEPWTDDLSSYYKTADLFLNTSLYEGYGRTMVEALAAGCPVVSTEVGIAGDLNYQGIALADQTNLGQIVFKLLSSPRPNINLSLPYKGRLDYLRLYKSLWLN